MTREVKRSYVLSESKEKEISLPSLLTEKRDILQRVCKDRSGSTSPATKEKRDQGHCSEGGRKVSTSRQQTKKRSYEKKEGNGGRPLRKRRTAQLEAGKTNQEENRSSTKRNLKVSEPAYKSNGERELNPTTPDNGGRHKKKIEMKQGTVGSARKTRKPRHLRRLKNHSNSTGKGPWVTPRLVRTLNRRDLQRTPKVRLGSRVWVKTLLWPGL